MPNKKPPPALPPLKQEDRLRRWRETTNALMAAAPPDTPHDVLLEALLSFYIAVAERHACCTATAADATWLAHRRLVQTATQRPPGAAVH